MGPGEGTGLMGSNILCRNVNITLGQGTGLGQGMGLGQGTGLGQGMGLGQGTGPGMRTGTGPGMDGLHTHVTTETGTGSCTGQ